MESEPILTPTEKSPLSEKILPRGGSNPQCCIKQDSKPNTQPTSYSSPQAYLKTHQILVGAVNKMVKLQVYFFVIKVTLTASSTGKGDHRQDCNLRPSTQMYVCTPSQWQQNMTPNDSNVWSESHNVPLPYEGFVLDQFVMQWVKSLTGFSMSFGNLGIKEKGRARIEQKRQR